MTQKLLMNYFLELNRIDQSLMKNINREDEEITYTTSKGEGKSTVSEILSQLSFMQENIVLKLLLP